MKDVTPPLKHCILQALQTTPPTVKGRLTVNIKVSVGSDADGGRPCSLPIDALVDPGIGKLDPRDGYRSFVELADPATHSEINVGVVYLPGNR